MNIGGMLHRLGNRMLMPFDLNHQQYSVFFEIGKAGKVKQKDMVNRLLLEKAHVSKIVKKLRNMDLITVTQSDDDKRSYWLSPTLNGEQILKKCRKLFEEWNQEWAGSMDEKQIASTLENLTHLQTVFRGMSQPDNT
jgi:DNA-binding MarR family transcriptional regulator